MDIRKNYVETGQVLFAYQQLPLETIHPLALPAAHFATCADQQGKFWGVHRDLLTNSRRVDETSLRGRIAEFGLNRETLEACLGDGKVRQFLRAGAERAAILGINSTPTFIVGRRLADGQVQPVARISGGKPDQIRDAIAAALLPLPNWTNAVVAGGLTIFGILLVIFVRRRTARAPVN